MGTRNFHWDPISDCVMQETDQTGATIVTYTNEPAEFGPLLSENRGGTKSYHHYDALGSTTMLSNGAGAVTDTFEYDAWGNSVSRAGTTDTPFQWVGRWGYQFDNSCGGYFVRLRPYQPVAARWDCLDFLSPRILENRYIYVELSSVLLVDPSGRSAAQPSAEDMPELSVLPQKPFRLAPKCDSPSAKVLFLFEIPRQPWPCRKGSPGGVFLQKVTTTCFAAGCEEGQTNQNFVYYETFIVLFGQVPGAKDTANFTAGNFAPDIKGKTRGSYRQSGTVKFYCVAPPDAAVAEGEISQAEAFDPRWQPGQVYGTGGCMTKPGFLNSTGDQALGETVFNRPATSTTGERYFWMTWDCCCLPRSAQAGARPDPR